MLQISLYEALAHYYSDVFREVVIKFMFRFSGRRWVKFSEQEVNPIVWRHWNG